MLLFRKVLMRIRIILFRTMRIQFCIFFLVQDLAKWCWSDRIRNSVLNFRQHHKKHKSVPENMSSESPRTTRKKWVYVVAILFGSRPKTAGICEPCGSLAIRTKTWMNGGGQLLNVPSTLIVVVRLNTSMPASLANTIIIFSGDPSTGPQYLK